VDDTSICAARNGYSSHCKVHVCSEAKHHKLFSDILNCTDLLTAKADLKNVQRVVSFTSYGSYSNILMKLI